MKRAELIEYVRLDLEQAEEDSRREDGTPWTWIDAAVSAIRDNLQTLDLGPQETLSLLQLLDESKLSAMILALLGGSQAGSNSESLPSIATSGPSNSFTSSSDSPLTTTETLMSRTTGSTLKPLALKK